MNADERTMIEYLNAHGTAGASEGREDERTQKPRKVLLTVRSGFNATMGDVWPEVN